MDYFIFNGKNSYEDYKIVLSEPPVIPFIQEEVNQIEILGRSGTVTERTGKYKDIILDRKLKMFSAKPLRSQIINIQNWLTDIEDNRLIESNINDKCYKVKGIVLGSIERELELYGVFTVKFICEPFLFDIFEYSEEVLNNSSIYYGGNIEGEPTLTIELEEGTHNIELTIGDTTIQAFNVSGILTMDNRKLMFLDSNKQNISWGGDFIKLKKGYNNITWIGPIKKLTVIKNTYYR